LQHELRPNPLAAGGGDIRAHVAYGSVAFSQHIPDPFFNKPELPVFLSRNGALWNLARNAADDCFHVTCLMIRFI
jgi:hypothetical protein